MPTAQVIQLPALCLIVSLITFFGWHFSSAVETKDTTSSNLFSSLSSSNDGSTPIPTKNGELSLSVEQLNSLLEQIVPQQKQQREGANTRNNHGHRRRKLLYELSVKAHYRNLARKSSDKTSPVAQEATTGSAVRCAYYNEGIDTIKPEDINGDGELDTSIFQRLAHWSFKICPQNSIEQVHLVPVIATEEETYEPIADIDIAIEEGSAIEIIKLPPGSDFSKKIQLMQTSAVDAGTFDNTLTAEEYFTKVKKSWGENEEDMYKESSEYYFDGSPCRYKPEGSRQAVTKIRRSKIIYEEECCERKAMIADHLFQKADEFTVLSVTEPLACQYVVQVCKICPDDIAVEAETTATQQTAEEEFLFSSVDPADFMHLMQTYLRHIPESEVSSDTDHYNPPDAFPPMPPSQIEANKELIRKMFIHAYDSYMYNAFPASELRPISCTPGTFNLVRIPALTLIDTLDTLILMRNYTEFARSVERIRYLDTKMKREYKRDKKDRKDEKGGLFSVNQNVSLFETTIRVLGGLLSAHQLALAFMKDVVPKSDVWDSTGEILWGYNLNKAPDSNMGRPKQHTSLLDNSLLSRLPNRPCIPQNDAYMQTSPDNSEYCWSYDGLFLTLAHDIGKRLVHAFDTDTGIPYGTVNMLHGVPSGETPIASLAGAGTLTLEFELLSRITGDHMLGKAAKRGTRSLWLKRARDLDLFGKHINVNSGVWTESLSGIGSNSDSFYEYLVKHYVLFPDDYDFWTMFIAAYAGVWKNSRIGDWYVDVDMERGLRGQVKQTFESLMAFYPGMQILLGELPAAAKTLSSFFLVREYLGLLPERFDFVHWRAEVSGDVHPLRPELLESAYFLHLATVGLHGSNNGPCSDSSTTHLTSSWLWAADFALHAVNRLAWIPCGFATVKKVSHKTTGSFDFVDGLSDNPELEQSKRNTIHHDEMPSFFLSETIKYLYLLFDSEDNLLHQDADREWIFTTEAHPIHHVPKWNSSAPEEGSIRRQEDVSRKKGYNINVEMDKIRLMLKQQLQRKSNQTDTDEDCMIKGDCPLNMSKALPQVLFDDLEEVDNVTTLNKNSTFESFGLKKGPLFRIELPQDEHQNYGIYSSEVSGINYAHTYLHGRGSGTNIGRRCPNFYHAHLTWPLALNGHTIDYGASHKAAASDFDNEINGDIRMRTALASTLYYGTDYYSDGVTVDSVKICLPQDGQAKQPANDKGKNKMHDTSHIAIPGAVRYDMGGNLGLFDVSAFQTGDGFVVRQVATGELLEVSMFQDALVSSGSIVILCSLTTPTEVSISSFVETKHPVSHLTTLKKSENLKNAQDADKPSYEPKKHERNPIIDYDLPEKRVVVADMNGNSFSCEIMIHKQDQVLVRLPCSPGFFGRAHIENLIQNDGVSITGRLHTPPPDDLVGCKPPDKESEINTNNFCLQNDDSAVIQIVYRGECNFTEKTLNQHIKRKAAAVIVINTNPMELFCMAGDKEITTSADGCSQMDYPPSVLVTGHDGDWLLDLFEFEKIDTSEITATVSISRQNNDQVTMFPFVIGEDNTLQTLATHGWGAQAVRQKDSTSSSAGNDNINGNNFGWQLFITAHNHRPNN